MEILGSNQQPPQVQAIVDAMVREMEARRQSYASASGAGTMSGVSAPSGPMPVFIAGQHAPLQVVIAGHKGFASGGGRGATPEEFLPKRRPVAEAAQAMTGAAQGLYGQGSGFIKNAAQAADPFSGVATLEASITQLSIAVGKQFLPLIDTVSQRIQETTKWFNGLDESTKTTAAKFVFWTVVGAGAITMGAKLVLTLKEVAAAIGIAGRAAMLSPIGAIAGTVAAVVALKAAWDGVNASASAANATSAQSRVEDRRAENAITEKDLRSLPADVREKLTGAGGDRQKVNDVLQEYAKKLEADLAARKGQSIPDLDKRRQRDEAINKALDEAGLSKKVEDYRAASREREQKEKRDRDSELRIGETASDWAARGNKLFEQQTPEKYRSLIERSLPGLNIARNIFSSRMEGELPAAQAERAGRTQQMADALAEAQRMLPEAMEAAKKAGLDIPKADIFNRLLVGLRRDDERQFGADNEKAAASPRVDARRFEAEKAGYAINNELKKLEDQKKLAGDLLNKSGKDDMQRALRNMPQTQILDPAAYADRIQQAVLNSDDMDAQNKIDQLQALLDSKELLTEIKTGLVNLRPQDKWRY